VLAKEAGIVAFKLYPAGATTNSASGVTDVSRVLPTLQKMAEVGAPSVATHFTWERESPLEAGRRLGESSCGPVPVRLFLDTAQEIQKFQRLCILDSCATQASPPHDHSPANCKAWHFPCHLHRLSQYVEVSLLLLGCGTMAFATSSRIIFKRHGR
jgi:hypothetical protein